MPITFTPLEEAETEGNALVDLLLSLEAAAVSHLAHLCEADLHLLLAVDARAINLLDREADVDLHLLLAVDAHAINLLASEFDAAMDLFVRCDAYVEQAADEPVVPLIPSNTNLDFVLLLDAEGELVRHMLFDAEVELELSVLALHDNSVELEMQLSVDAVGPFIPFSYIFASERGMAVVCYAGAAFDEYVVGLNFADSTEANITLVLESLARFNDVATWIARLEMTLESSLSAKAVFGILLEANFVDTLALTDAPDLTPRMVIALADQLVLSGEITNYMDALIAISAAFVLGDTGIYGQDMTVEDTLQIDATTVEEITALIELADQLDLSDELVPTATFTAVLTDELVLAVEDQYGMSALIELLDTMELGARFSLPGNDGGLYIGYAMNLRNAGVTTYDNYPFVDAAVVGGLPLAVNEDGLFLLEGDDDDGTPIRAKLRTGLTDFGSDVLKHVPNLWVGYTTDGSLVLKVVTTDTGVKKENWYRLKARTSPAPTDERFSPAKGLVARYWGFEIVNVDGANFELDVVRAWPFMVQRRKSGR
jgi:hypothetical protein